MTEDLYNKPEKAGTQQQLRSRIALLEDQMLELEKEKVDILSEIVKLKTQLGNNQ